MAEDFHQPFPRFLRVGGHAERVAYRPDARIGRRGRRRLRQFRAERERHRVGDGRDVGERAVERGVAEATATYIFDLMEKFAEYGFNKSHAAAYALVAYQTAYMKAHYPSAFMAANLSAVMDDTDKLHQFRDDTLANGLKLLPPDVNQGIYRFHPVDAKTIRYGLGAVKGTGDAVGFYWAEDSDDEARWVIEDIAKKGLSPREVAILFRTNAQARQVEEALRMKGLHYVVVGGIKFYARKEIKDIIAYFRLVANPDDEEAIKRIINYPARGIGATTVLKIAVSSSPVSNSKASVRTMR